MRDGIAKRAMRSLLGRAGYSVRHVGTGVTGVDLLHDCRELLGNRRSPMLFDVGANIGQTTLAMLASFEAPRIIAFEPSPATAEILKATVGSRPGVHVEAAALGDSPGTQPFYVTREHSVNDSLLAPTWDSGARVVQVTVETVDGYCRRQQIDAIDLLKVDAQGFDLQVLKGAGPMLRDRRIKLYSCEANLEQIYDSQTSLRELLAFADEVGYRLVGFYEQTYVRNQLSYLDALFSAP